MRRSLVCIGVLAIALAGTPARALPPQLAGGLGSDNVRYVGTIPEPGVLGARILDDVLYVTTTQGLRIYSLSDPTGTGLPVPIGAIDIPNFGNEDIDTNGEIALIASDHFLDVRSMLYVIDVSNPHVPALLAAYPTTETAHTLSCIDDCRYGWLAGDSTITVIDLTVPSSPRSIARFYRDGSSNPDAGDLGSHDVDVDPAGIAWVSAGAGLFAFDPSSDPVNPRLVASRANGEPGAFDNQFIIHNSMRPDADLATAEGLADGDIDPGEVVYVTEEDWVFFDNSFCGEDGAFQTGWFHTVDGVPVVERLDTFTVGADFDDSRTLLETEKLPAAATCSSHYFDVSGGVAAVAWYEQGVRFLDVSDAHDIRQIGFFLPLTTQAIATKFHRGYVCSFDLDRGIDVLRFSGSAGDASVAGPSVRPVAPDARPHPSFGFACRVAV